MQCVNLGIKGAFEFTWDLMKNQDSSEYSSRRNFLNKCKILQFLKLLWHLNYSGFGYTNNVKVISIKLGTFSYQTFNTMQSTNGKIGKIVERYQTRPTLLTDAQRV